MICHISKQPKYALEILVCLHKIKNNQAITQINEVDEVRHYGYYPHAISN